MFLHFNDFKNLRYVVLDIGTVHFSASSLYKVIDR